MYVSESEILGLIDEMTSLRKNDAKITHQIIGYLRGVLLGSKIVKNASVSKFFKNDINISYMYLCKIIYSY